MIVICIIFRDKNPFVLVTLSFISLHKGRLDIVLALEQCL